jgi:hypothetical protein
MQLFHSNKDNVSNNDATLKIGPTYKGLETHPSSRTLFQSS